MLTDWTDSDSIRAWLAVAPERHREIMRGLWRLWPQYRQAMEDAAR